MECSMECSVRIVREQKRIAHLYGQKPTTIIQVYCPVLGELVLSGEQAERAIRHIRETQGPESMLS